MEKMGRNRTPKKMSTKNKKGSSFEEIQSAVIDILEGAPAWIILTHVKPDGDTLGSGSALYSLGASLGKKVFWGGEDPYPRGYSFLPEAGSYITGIDPGELLHREGGAAIILDTSTEDRSLPGVRALSEKFPVINIDHHGDNELFGSLNWIDPAASSVGEMVWSLLSFWKKDYPLKTAEGLYTAIVTDSGNFTFSSTGEKTHRAAADLLSRGVAPEKIEDLLRSNRSLSSLHLWGRAFERAEIHSSFAGVTWLFREDFAETGSAPSETEFLVNELLTLRGITFAAFLVEEEDAVRASLRSKGDISAVEIARTFGGGGHLNAAGCKIPLPLESAKDTLVELLEKLNALRAAPSR